MSAAVAVGVGIGLLADGKAGLWRELQRLYNEPLAAFEQLAVSNAQPLISSMGFLQGMPKDVPLHLAMRTLSRADVSGTGAVGDLARLVAEIELEWPIAMARTISGRCPRCFDTATGQRWQVATAEYGSYFTDYRSYDPVTEQLYLARDISGGTTGPQPEIFGMDLETGATGTRLSLPAGTNLAFGLYVLPLGRSSSSDPGAKTRRGACAGTLTPTLGSVTLARCMSLAPGALS